MIITNGVGITTLKNGAAVKRVLSAANSTVNKGVYDATLLETVDADLAAANILTGKNIFGKDGVVVPGVDVSDADALVTDVKDPKTFYSVAAPRKTGTMPTVALDPAANAYPAGYHVGAASLTAVDADLATGNIKSGITIFGVAGAATVQDISAADAAVANVLSPKTFFSVTGAIKTGTMPTVALDPANDTVAAGYYAATTLSTVDADLAAANIKSGVTIFGKVGTVTPFPAIAVSDTQQWANDDQKTTSSLVYVKRKQCKLNLALPVCRVQFNLQSWVGGWVYGKIYKNGVAIGTERSTQDPNFPGTLFSEDFAGFLVNDLIQLYAYTSNGALATVRNFRFCFSFTDIITNQDPA